MIKKITRILSITLVVVFVCIQFVPADLPGTKSDNPADLIQNGLASEEVAIVLKTSCYDCHSNQTTFPWYSYVAPVSWLIKRDVDKGREELNFSEWKNYKKRKLLKKLNDIGEEVEEGEMPLPIYTLTHRNARINKEQKELILQWSKQESTRLTAE